MTPTAVVNRLMITMNMIMMKAMRDGDREDNDDVVNVFSDNEFCGSADEQWHT